MFNGFDLSQPKFELRLIKLDFKLRSFPPRTWTEILGKFGKAGSALERSDLIVCDARFILDSLFIVV